MSHKRLWIAAGIIALIVLTGFMLSVPHTRDVEEQTPVIQNALIIPNVVLRDSFKKGVHTITGSIEVPNKCTSVNASASVQSTASTTGSIMVDVSIVPNTGVCLQLPTQSAFETTISAPADFPIEVMVNGATSTISAS